MHSEITVGSWNTIDIISHIFHLVLSKYKLKTADKGENIP